MKLKGANIVVMGGSSGIGLAAAKLAQHEGATVTIAGRSLEKLAQAQRELDGVRTVVADVTDDASVGRVFEELDHVDHVLISASSTPLAMRFITVPCRASARNAFSAAMKSSAERLSIAGIAPWLRPSGP